MADNAYNVEIELPFLGKVAGTLAISQGAAGAVATVSAMGTTMDLACNIENGTLTAGGDVKLPMGINRFDVIATLTASGLEGQVKTNKGTFPFKGSAA